MLKPAGNTSPSLASDPAIDRQPWTEQAEQTKQHQTKESSLQRQTMVSVPSQAIAEKQEFFTCCSTDRHILWLQHLAQKKKDGIMEIQSPAPFHSEKSGQYFPS